MPERSIFARKNYFYPDMPKDYQTSQYDQPITVDGWLEVDGERVGITRAHLEEDTGKTMHIGGGGRIHDAEYSFVDYNRAGVPLLEIVSEPDIRSSEQAKRYVEELRATLLAIGVSDVKMEEGSLRIDANVSVRPGGFDRVRHPLRDQEPQLAAFAREGDRARSAAPDHRAGASATRSCRRPATGTKQRGRTISGRSKEEAHDYRYFPEPDLVPVAPDRGDARARAGHAARAAGGHAVPLGRRLGHQGDRRARARRVARPGGVRRACDRGVEVGHAARTSSTGCVRTCSRTSTSSGLSPAVLTPEMLAELVGLVADGTISRNQGKDVLDESLREDKWPRDIVEARGLAQVSDEGALVAVLDEVLAANAAVVEEYRAGDDKARKKKRGFLMGELNKALQGKGNLPVLNKLLDDRLA